MKKIDRRIIIVASLIFIIGLSYGIMKFLIAQKAAPPATRAIEARRYVEASVIHYSEILSPVSEPGRMASVSEIDISAEATGKVLRGDINLKKGATFRKGDVLFTIYPDEAALSLKAQKSSFLNSLALLLPDIAIDFPAYEEAFHNFFNHINIEKPLPAFPEVEDEKLKVFLASKNILSEFYTIRRAELQLSRHAVIAPFDGALTEVFLETGAFTNTGGRIAHAIRTDRLELEAPLMRFDAAWVKEGDPVTITSELLSESWKGRVVRKSKFVDENTQSQSVFVEVINHKEHPLLSGEYLRATFPGHPIEGVMEIPRNAVFNSNQVFVVKNRRLQNQTINIVKTNTRTLLFNGLPEGDTLVVQPLINVYEGTQVTTSLDKKEKQEPPVPPPSGENGKKGSKGKKNKS